MNGDAIVRQIRIDMILDQPNAILDWFKNIWHHLRIKRVDVYYGIGCEWIYYLHPDQNKKQWMVYHDTTRGCYWLNCEKFWNLLYEHHNVEPGNARVIFQFLMTNVMEKEIAKEVIDYLQDEDRTIEEALEK